MADELAQAAALELREFHSPAEVDTAIDELRHRIASLEQLDINPARLKQTRTDHIIAGEIRDAIRDAFGTNSPEFAANRDLRIWSGPEHLDMTDAEIIAGTESGRARAIEIVNGLIKQLEERKEALIAGTVPNTYFDRLPLHPRIRNACRNLFLRGDHWNAVFAGANALANYVRERSGHQDLDDVQLMRVAFSKPDPILAFNDLAGEAALDEQEGLLNLFKGAVLAVRNPEKRSVSQDSDRRAIEYICLLSFLAHRLEEAKVRKTTQPLTQAASGFQGP